MNFTSEEISLLIDAVDIWEQTQAHRGGAITQLEVDPSQGISGILGQIHHAMHQRAEEFTAQREQVMRKAAMLKTKLFQLKDQIEDGTVPCEEKEQVERALGSYTAEVLEAMMEKAVKSENYDLAARIRDEINSRKNPPASDAPADTESEN